MRIADLCLDWSGKPERELHWIEMSVEAIQWCQKLGMKSTCPGESVTSVACAAPKSGNRARFGLCCENASKSTAECRAEGCVLLRKYSFEHSDGGNKM